MVLVVNSTILNVKLTPQKIHEFYCTKFTDFVRAGSRLMFSLDSRMQSALKDHLVLHYKIRSRPAVAFDIYWELVRNANSQTPL